MSSATLLARLQGLHPRSIDLSLERMERLLAALGHPESRLPPVVHVAGTNGKGSSIAFLRAIAEAMGLRVHVYTSPHLCRFHERIVLAGEAIDENVLVDCLLRAEEANGGDPITSFEITTAAALIAFAEMHGDLLLLETGLGGRLDATNVVEKPLVTSITPISIDHVAFLGSTIPAIAAEKSGILRPQVPCVVGRQEAIALEVIERRAEAIGSPLHVFGRDFFVTERQRRLVYRDSTQQIDLPLPQLKGRHQVDNAGAAIATACIAFAGDVTTAALERGMNRVKWPARLERLDVGALHAYVDDDTEIWLDGGHNPASSQAIAQTLREFDDPASSEVHLIWGMMETKDAHAVIAPFKGHIKRVYTVPIPDEEGAFSATALAEIAASAGFNAIATSGVAQALRTSQATRRRPGRVLVFGSLYLAGHVLKMHGMPQPSPATDPDLAHVMRTATTRSKSDHQPSSAP